MSTQLLDMLTYIADTNAADVRVSKDVRAANRDEREWVKFKAKAEKVNRLLIDDQSGGFSVADQLEEDDAELLVAVVEYFESKNTPQTLAEVVRGLQREKILSIEFESAARTRAKWLLKKLQEMRKIQSDVDGRWSLCVRPVGPQRS